jgi:glutathione synthase/RimK-type ligase-like ATP-grasp enzyme
VYQAELFEKNDIPCPKTIIVHKDNAGKVGELLGFPCVLKRPDSSFSAGVVKAENPPQLAMHLEAFLDESELVVAQEYLQSSFDWRVGVLDRKALYVCKYHMAPGHWQIQNSNVKARQRYGRVETLAVDSAPAGAVELGIRAAGLIGEGLYGVDIKEVSGRFVVMEINDNPSLEAGYEDAVLKDELYISIMSSFFNRLEQRGRSAGRG